MSVLKAIFHKWNETSNAYDTLHPETEHAQVTDFGQGTIAHLIATTLASTVTACSTDSVFGKLVEKLLTASGVQYNFTNSNAWYICLGSLFGGLIIQGGKFVIPANADVGTFSWPISITTPLSIAELDGGSNLQYHALTYWDATIFKIKRNSTGNMDDSFYIIAIAI